MSGLGLSADKSSCDAIQMAAQETAKQAQVTQLSHLTNMKHETVIFGAGGPEV